MSTVFCVLQHRDPLEAYTEPFDSLPGRIGGLRAVSLTLLLWFGFVSPVRLW